MATTSRRRSAHGITSSGSSTQLARRGSSSRLGGPRGRFDPGLMMSSNTTSGEGNRDRSPHDDATAAHDTDHHQKVTRRNKSSDRLPRSRDSSTQLSNKRSKSFTHLAMTADDPNRRRKSGKGKGKSQRPQAEDGWTSASADNTSSDHSAPLSPSSSPPDEGLVLGIKKRLPPQLKPVASTTLPEPKKEAFLQPPDTPRASAKTLEPESRSEALDNRRLEPPSGTTRALESPSGYASSPGVLTREDTSKTLVDSGSHDDGAREAIDAQPIASSVSDLDPNLSAPAHDTSSASARVPSQTDSALTIDTANQPRHHRVSSSASNRTLRMSLPMPASPSSVRSRSSVLSSRFLPFPRESQAAAPPMLDTHNALAGRLGARHEDRGEMLSPMAGPSRSGRSVSAMISSTSAPVALDKQQHASPDNRRILGQGALPLRSPAAATTQTGSGTVGSQQRSGRDDVSDRRRTASTQSLTAADAAKLAAKLRLARDSMDDHMLGNTGSTQRGAQAYNPRLEKYKKPVVSTFVKDSAAETPQAIEVQASSVYSRLFAQAHDSQDGEEAGRRLMRYVMGYGISGPPIEKSRLSDALLGPSLDMAEFESSWAPALAHAAGLGATVPASVQTEYGLVAAEAPAATGGPNATPLHLIHGLTTTSPDPFPLDPTDVPALQEDGDVFESHRVSQLAQNPIQLVEPGLIRAIAITTHAIAIHRSHVVTRRYADPMREGLERVVRSSGRYVPAPKSSAGPNGVPDSPQMSSRWGRKTAPNSPMSSRIESRDLAYRPSFQRRNTSEPTHHGQHSSTSASTNLAGQLYNLVDAAEHPVRSLKRVWSGGVARGGLAALTRTDEES